MRLFHLDSPWRQGFFNGITIQGGTANLKALVRSQNYCGLTRVFNDKK